MKKLFLVLCLCFLSSLGFSYEGIMAGEKELRVSSTKWFDIIYPPECAESAKIIYENADALYEAICSSYNTQPYFRMPVTITKEVESFNAYWSNGYYNRIVLYDTAVIDELAVFSETILSTFRHELTHAVTFNLKSGLMKWVSKVFGDSISVQFWLTSTGMSESATVTMESSDGEGRLNDEFIMQEVKQAKIENAFPDYYDVQGASDVYPAGVYYYYDAAFYQYLQNKYGMEKYAMLWYLSINMGAMDFASAFKKVYGTELKAEWKEFIGWFKVPLEAEENPDPVKAGFVQDFFDSSKKGYSILNENGSIYESLTVSAKGLAYIDSSDRSVYFRSGEEGSQKIKRLFNFRGIQKIRFSEDGRFLAVDYLGTDTKNYKRKITIYDVENKSFFELKEAGVENGAVIEKDGEYYLAYTTFSSQYYGLKVQKISLNEKGRISGFEQMAETAFEYGIVPSSVTGAGNGKIAYIKKDKLNYTINLCDLDLSNPTGYALPYEKNVIRYLAYAPAENKLTFSWTKKGTLPRYGEFDLSKKNFALLQKDISGGIFEPVLENGKIIYGGHFYNQVRLLQMEGETAKALKFESVTAKVSGKTGWVKEGTISTRNSFDSLTLPYEKYSFFKHTKKGLIIPFSSLESKSYFFDGATYSLPWGITYTTSDPWGGLNYTFEAGYGHETQSVGISASISSETNITGYEVKGSLEFDKLGVKQENLNLYGYIAQPVGTVSAIQFSDSILFNEGRQNRPGNIYDTERFWLISNYFTAAYSSVHQSGPSRFEKGGITIGAGLTSQFYYSTYNQISLFSSIYLPRLLPVTNRRGFIYNLPTRIDGNLFCSNAKNTDMNLLGWEINFGIDKKLPVYNLASVELETILFGYEIQKTVPLLLFIYANEVRLSFVYAGGWTETYGANQSWKIAKLPDYVSKMASGEIPYSQYFGFNVDLGLSMNFGGPFKFNLGFTYAMSTQDGFKDYCQLLLDARF